MIGRTFERFLYLSAYYTSLNCEFLSKWVKQIKTADFCPSQSITAVFPIFILATGLRMDIGGVRFYTKTDTQDQTIHILQLKGDS